MDGVLACPAGDCGRLNVEEADECCYCGHQLQGVAMTNAESERESVLDPYYHESETEDGELVAFEAGAWLERHEPENQHHVEGGPLAICEMSEPARYGPYYENDCHSPAIAKIDWGDGTESKVCRKHYEQVRGDYKWQAKGGNA